MASESTTRSDEGLLKLQDVAKLLGCSRRNVGEMITAGTLHAVDISVHGTKAKRHTWRVRRREVDAFIRSRVMRAAGREPADEGPASDVTRAA